MGVSAPKGYGPGSLSLAYWNETLTRGCPDGTTVYGMPYGLVGSPDGPKSGWRFVVEEFMLASHCALCASTGSDEISVFHTLSDGNIGHVPAPGTGAPARAGPTLTVAVPNAVAATQRTMAPDRATRVRGPERGNHLTRICGSSARWHKALSARG
jgi:hypothetical protein